VGFLTYFAAWLQTGKGSALKSRLADHGVRIAAAAASPLSGWLSITPEEESSSEPTGAGRHFSSVVRLDWNWSYGWQSHC
jgi:hypothetical protein